MEKFDGIKMKDLVKVEEADGVLTMTFTDNKIMKITVVDGKLSSEVQG